MNKFNQLKENHNSFYKLKNLSESQNNETNNLNIKQKADALENENPIEKKLPLNVSSNHVGLQP
jgi:hypothetical protein